MISSVFDDAEFWHKPSVKENDTKKRLEKLSLLLPSELGIGWTRPDKKGVCIRWLDRKKEPKLCYFFYNGGIGIETSTKDILSGKPEDVKRAQHLTEIYTKDLASFCGGRAVLVPDPWANSKKSRGDLWDVLKKNKMKNTRFQLNELSDEVLISWIACMMRFIDEVRSAEIK